VNNAFFILQSSFLIQHSEFSILPSYLRNMSESILLTSLSKGSGCGCKINPDTLKELLSGFTIGNEVPNLVVGNSMAEDCSVYDLGDGRFLLQTVDFFTPVVNDPYVFGAAAAANALSDIWAMGGKPIMANAVFSWPLEKLPLEMGKKVLQGANDICKKAGVPLAGGHSIDGQEALFGLSVTGMCQAAHLKQNSGAKAGDLIYLTRPLGSGMLAAAHKRGQSSAEQDKALYAHLQHINEVGAFFGSLEAVHAMTDVTGFGLAGHLLEMCRASGLGAEIRGASLPKIPEAESLAASFVLPDNAMRNWNAYEKEMNLQDQSAFPWLVDPQTNGGLLVAVDAGWNPKDHAEIGEFSLIGKFTQGDLRVTVI
jgi:selenide,water dikinase